MPGLRQQVRGDQNRHPSVRCHLCTRSRTCRKQSEVSPGHCQCLDTRLRAQADMTPMTRYPCENMRHILGSAKIRHFCCKTLLCSCTLESRSRERDLELTTYLVIDCGGICSNAVVPAWRDPGPRERVSHDGPEVNRQQSQISCAWDSRPGDRKTGSERKRLYWIRISVRKPH